MKISLLPVSVLCACSFAFATDNNDALRMTNNRPTSRVMDNGDVLRMMKTDAPTSEILRQINTTLPGYRLFPEDILHLRDRSVPEAVIDAMMVRNRQEV